MTAPAVEPPAMDTARREVVIHEAGHGVIGAAYGLKIQRVTACADPLATLAGGYTVTGPEPLTLTEADLSCRLSPAGTVPSLAAITSPLQEYLIYVSAGAQAAKHAGVYTVDSDWIDRFLIEHLIAQALRVKVFHKRVREFELIFATVARAAAVRHWNWIENAAAALHERGTLTGDELRALKPSRR